MRYITEGLLFIYVFHWPGVIDFDAETGDDPQQHGEYAMQTFQYYKVGAGRHFTYYIPVLQGRGW